MEKYKREAVSPVERENERYDGYRSSNTVDEERTKDNYHLVAPQGRYIGFINACISTLTLKRKIRSDAIYLNSLVLGGSADFHARLTPEEERQFFQDCVDFCSDKYGRENIISAIVHKDETTPHLHLNFVPIVDGKLCSKDLFDKKKLALLQTEFYEKVGKKWGLKRGKEKSTAKHITAAEHKVKVAEKRAAELDARSVEQMQAQSETERQLIDLKAEKRQTETEVRDLSTQKERLAQEVEKLTEVKSAADEPVPVFGKGATITALRVENAQLKQQLAEKDKAVQIAQKDQTDMFKELQRVQQEQDTESRYKATIEAMRRADPTAFNALLEKARNPKPSNSSLNRNRNTK